MGPLDPGSAAPLQLIAMHGWAGTAAGWDPWRAEAQARGWCWQCGERGYGTAPAALPAWQPAGQRVLISHSLGLHLLPAALLAAADRVVLLASFGRFVPPGREGRQLRSALAAMAAQLAEGPDEAETAARVQQLLRSFLARAMRPAAAGPLPPGPADRPVGPAARQRLRKDLALLAATTGLPAGFPSGVPVLLVEAAADQIVLPETRCLLRLSLPNADCISLAGAGHTFLGLAPDSGLPQAALLQAAVLQWLERRPTP